MGGEEVWRIKRTRSVRVEYARILFCYAQPTHRLEEQEEEGEQKRM